MSVGGKDPAREVRIDDNPLWKKVVEVVVRGPQGKVLDLGCGDGRIGRWLLEGGFEVQAFDIDEKRFRFHGQVPFRKGSLDESLPYSDSSFDSVVLMEVLEHVYNPDFVIREIARVLKPAGRLVLTTPNILHVGSRLRFLFEGSYDFFREPILDYSKRFPVGLQNMHVIPWRYQDLEHLLFKNGLSVAQVHTDTRRKGIGFWAALLKPFVFLRGKAKERRSRSKGGVDYSRINRILLSHELWVGRYLILECRKGQ